MFEAVLLSLVTLGVLVMVGFVLATPYLARRLPDEHADEGERAEAIA